MDVCVEGRHVVVKENSRKSRLSSLTTLPPPQDKLAAGFLCASSAAEATASSPPHPLSCCTKPCPKHGTAGAFGLCRQSWKGCFLSHPPSLAVQNLAQSMEQLEPLVSAANLGKAASFPTLSLLSPCLLLRLRTSHSSH